MGSAVPSADEAVEVAEGGDEAGQPVRVLAPERAHEPLPRPALRVPEGSQAGWAEGEADPPPRRRIGLADEETLGDKAGYELGGCRQRRSEVLGDPRQVRPGVAADEEKGPELGDRQPGRAARAHVATAVIGIHLRLELPGLAGVAAVTVTGAAGFATFSLITACLVRTRERFMGIGQVLTMPLFFASSAVYPIALMPAWLQVVARLNPLT